MGGRELRIGGERGEDGIPHCVHNEMDFDLNKQKKSSFPNYQPGN